jgi:hypothetical protein
MNAVPSASTNKSRLEIIEDRARYTALDLWNRREELWPASNVPQVPVDALEPGVALASLGFEVVTRAELGMTIQDGIKVEAAGILDRTKNCVLISARYPYTSQRFTLAHELAHLLLHPNIDVLHRDRPVDGHTIRKDWREREADWFAACLLMPARQVRRYFLQAFGCDSISAREELFAFSTDVKLARQARFESPRRLRSLEIAQAVAFGGRSIPQLSRVFGVTPRTMALRLEELNLVTE